MKIYLQARGSYQTLLDLSTWCESNNIERIGLPDHYIVGKQRKNKDEPAPALDLLTAIAGLVRDTESMIYSVLDLQLHSDIQVFFLKWLPLLMKWLRKDLD